MINLEKSLEAKALPLIKGTADMFIVGYIFRKKTLVFPVHSATTRFIDIVTSRGGGTKIFVCAD